MKCALFNRSLLAALIGCLWLIPGQAQGLWKFRSVESGGLLTGEKGNFGQLQSINGLYKGSWFLGVGAGLDYYRFRSVPLFLSVNKDLMPHKNGLFLSLDGGVDYPWYKRPQSQNQFAPLRIFHPGAYWSGSLGYKFRISPHGKELLLSAGYSFKKLEEDFTYYYPPCVQGGCPVTTPPDHYDYDNQRVSMKAGISF